MSENLTRCKFPFISHLNIHFILSWTPMYELHTLQTFHKKLWYMCNVQSLIVLPVRYMYTLAYFNIKKKYKVLIVVSHCFFFYLICFTASCTRAQASLPGFQVFPLRQFGTWAPDITSKLNPEKDVFVLVCLVSSAYTSDKLWSSSVAQLVDRVSLGTRLRVESLS